MCGIAGLLRPTRDADLLAGQLIVERMLNEMRHRGPDAQGVRTIRGATIGAARLAIVGGTEGAQPLRTACSPFQIVFNGEVYNFRQLRRLIGTHHHNVSDSDTETILHLYEQYGCRSFDWLNGMFSFCITNGRQAVLARDHLGIKPLYYRMAGTKMLFASELKPLMPVHPTLNLEQSYANTETNVGAETVVRGIFEVPPSSIVEFDAERCVISCRKYGGLHEPSTAVTNKDDAVEAFRYILESAVQLRIPQKWRHACYVSGGIDSAVVAGISAPDAVATSTAADPSELDESRFQRAILKATNAEVILVEPSPSTFLSDVVGMVDALEYPTTTLAALPQYLLARAVARRGYRVTLSGLGADEYLGGYARHVAAMTGFQMPPPGLEDYRDLFDRSSGIDAVPDRYTELVDRGRCRSPAVRRLVHESFGAHRSQVNAMAAIDFLVSFPPLLRTDDRLNMRFGIESRSPFLDKRLIAFAWTLDDSLRIKFDRGGTVLTKYILREAARGFAPSLILERRDKIGFPSPVLRWLQSEIPHAVHNARRVLRDVAALTPILEGSTPNRPYARSDWQVIQWAIWYMRFIQRLSLQSIESYLGARA